MSYNIRYRFRNKETGEILSWTDGSSMLVNKKGDICITPPNNTRMRNKWQRPYPNLVLEVATSKRNGEWYFKPVKESVVNVYTPTYLFHKVVKTVQGLYRSMFPDT